MNILQLFEALIDFGTDWDDDSLAMLAGGNLLRVLRQVGILTQRLWGNFADMWWKHQTQVEAAADRDQGDAGDNTWLEEAQQGSCRS